MFDFNLERIILTIPAILIALTFHELSHGYVAYLLGDQTAKLQGRLSLNPIKHLDPLGALCLLIIGFGWAKPVPVNPYELRGKNKEKSMALVALAGPVSNILQIVLGALLLALCINTSIWQYINSDVLHYVIYFLIYYVQINAVLAIFNLIPLPPLDGSRIVAGFMPYDVRQNYYRIERYGTGIMAILCITSIISYILSPPVKWICDLVFDLVGLS